MNKYESIFIIKSDSDEEKVKSVISSVEEEIKKNEGEVREVNSWGKRELAYVINKCNQGFYYQINFDVAPSALKGMKRKWHLTDSILRFMIIKLEKE